LAIVAVIAAAIIGARADGSHDKAWLASRPRSDY
jgi:hypothetical protein